MLRRDIGAAGFSKFLSKNTPTTVWNMDERALALPDIIWAMRLQNRDQRTSGLFGDSFLKVREQKSCKIPKEMPSLPGWELEERDITARATECLLAEKLFTGGLSKTVREVTVLAAG
jgi:hypothetical protein